MEKRTFVNKNHNETQKDRQKLDTANRKEIQFFYSQMINSLKNWAILGIFFLYFRRFNNVLNSTGSK